MGSEASEPRKIKRPMAETVENLMIWLLEWICFKIAALGIKASAAKWDEASTLAQFSAWV